MRKVFLLLLALAGLLGATPVGAADDCPFTAVRSQRRRENASEPRDPPRQSGIPRTYVGALCDVDLGTRLPD